MKDLKAELKAMHDELLELFYNKKEELKDKNLDPYKHIAVVSTELDITRFQLFAMMAVYENYTVPNFEEDFERIKKIIQLL